MPNGTASVISDHGDKLDLLNLLSIDINGAVYLKMWCEQNHDQTNAPILGSLEQAQRAVHFTIQGTLEGLDR